MSDGAVLHTLGVGCQPGAFSPDSRSLWGACPDALERVAVDGRGSRLRIAAEHAHAGTMAISPDGAHVALSAASSARTRGISLWRVEDRRLLWRAEGSWKLEPSFLVFSPDGRQLAASSYHLHQGASQEQQGVRLFDVATGARVSLDPSGFGRAAYSPDGALLAVHSTPTVRVFRLHDRTRFDLPPVPAPPPAVRGQGIAFTPDGRLLVNEGDGVLHTWCDIQQGASGEKMPMAHSGRTTVGQ